jgi:nitrate/TMAO reductase-like tetraheme cytochrome c subunit
MTPFCISCHAPLATLTNTVPENPFDPKQESPLLADAVSCEFCHTISGKEVQIQKLSLGAYLFPRVGQTEILYGRHPDAKTEAHLTQPSQFLLSSELCGTCHRFGHPVSGMAIQDTYAEWKQSPYAAQGVRCQDCHMPAYAGRVAVDGKDRTELHAHVFLGGHTEMIRKAATLRVNSEWGQRDGKDSLKVTVSITNSGAGHLIPTGIPGIREMWLEVSAFSGGQQQLATERRGFGLELLDSAGKSAMPWDAARLGRDTRIGPKKTRQEIFHFKLNKAGEVRLEAKLLERLISESAARYAGIPATSAMSMAEVSATIP